MSECRGRVNAEKMTVLIVSLVCCLAGASPSFSSDFPGSKKGFKLEVENSLDDCVLVSIDNVHMYRNILLAKMTLDLKKEIGYCGCRSAIASYTVYQQIGGRRHNYTYAPFGLKESESYEIPVLIDPSLVPESELFVRVQCSSA